MLQRLRPYIVRFARARARTHASVGLYLTRSLDMRIQFSRLYNLHLIHARIQFIRPYINIYMYTAELDFAYVPFNALIQGRSN